MSLMRPTGLKRISFFVLSDVILSACTLLLAYGLRFNFEIPQAFMASFFNIFLLLVVFKRIAFMYFHVYMIAWRFFSLEDARRLILAHLFSYGAFSFIILL